MLNSGDVFYSPGGAVRYEVIGAVCRLYDREELPYPCCRLQWMGKEPFWNRIGKRFVPDLAARRCESYNVKVLGYDTERVCSLYYKKLSQDEQAWWFTLDRKKEKYVSESYFFDGHSECSKQSDDIRETYHIGRRQEHIVHGNERSAYVSVLRRVENS